jgi:hypothetical protein
MPGREENSSTASSRSFEVNRVGIKMICDKNNSIISGNPDTGVIFICNLFTILAIMFSGK